MKKIIESGIGGGDEPYYDRDHTSRKRESQELKPERVHGDVPSEFPYLEMKEYKSGSNGEKIASSFASRNKTEITHKQNNGHRRQEPKTVVVCGPW